MDSYPAFAEAYEYRLLHDTDIVPVAVHVSVCAVAVTLAPKIALEVNKQTHARHPNKTRILNLMETPLSRVYQPGVTESVIWITRGSDC